MSQEQVEKPVEDKVEEQVEKPVEEQVEDKSEKQVEEQVEEQVKDKVTQMVEAASNLIEGWTKQDAGDIGKWFGVMESLVKLVQDKHVGEMTGIEKAELATDTIIQLARKCLKKHIDGLSKEEADKLKNGELKMLLVIIENPSILKASTSIFKKILQSIDKDGDGNISAEECKMFWCCGKLDACDIKRLNKEK